MKQFGKMTLEDVGSFLSKLAERSESVYWLSSPDFKKIQYISPAYEKIWGRSRQELYDNPELWITFLHPKDPRDHHPIHAMREQVAKLGPDARYDENYRIVRPNGEIRWIIDRGFPIYTDHGECCGVTGVAVDVTLEKEAEILRKEKQVAQVTNERLKAIGGSMVHQMSTPLSAVRIAHEHIQEKLPELTSAYRSLARLGHITPKLSTEELETIEASSNKILHRIDKADFVIEHHLINLQENRWHTPLDMALIQSCSMTEVIEEAINGFPFIENQKSLIQWEKGEDFEVLGEQDLLVNVIQNLIENALESIHNASMGKVMIWIEKGLVFNKVHIKDTGEGLARTGRKKIFNPFYTTRKHGTGLGLYFCKSVIGTYLGEISARGQMGHYAFAQFTLTFPLYREARRKFIKKAKSLLKIKDAEDSSVGTL